jgi:hypothetical protein
LARRPFPGFDTALDVAGGIEACLLRRLYGHRRAFAKSIEIKIFNFGRNCCDRALNFDSQR